MITVRQNHIKTFLSFVFSSQYKHHPFILQIGRQCYNSVIHFLSSQDVKNVHPISKLLDSWIFFPSTILYHHSSDLFFLKNKPQSEDAETLQKIF